VQRLSSSASRFWLRPAKDLLQRVPKISASQPAICDVCCGDGSSSHMLLEWCPSVLQLHCLDTAEAISALQRDDVLASRSAVRFVGSTVNAHFDGSPTGSLYDLIVSPSGMIPRSVSSTDLLDLLQRQMARVRPGGSLALQIPDARLQPSHLLLEQIASEFGVSANLPAPASELDAARVADALLGPLCSEIEIWSTTYAHRLTGEAPVYAYMQEHMQLELTALMAQLGGEDSQAAVAFRHEYRMRVAADYPQSRDGSTYLGLTHTFLVARRPSLLDVYSEYAAYHNHQLDKGWKS